jgi:hypothetical protein
MKKTSSNAIHLWLVLKKVGKRAEALGGPHDVG